jgi:hypothetical protein
MSQITQLYELLDELPDEDLCSLEVFCDGSGNIKSGKHEELVSFGSLCEGIERLDAYIEKRGVKKSKKGQLIELLKSLTPEEINGLIEDLEDE